MIIQRKQYNDPEVIRIIGPKPKWYKVLERFLWKEIYNEWQTELFKRKCKKIRYNPDDSM